MRTNFIVDFKIYAFEKYSKTCFKTQNMNFTL